MDTKYNTVDELYERLVDHIVTGYGNFEIRILDQETGKLAKIKDIYFQGKYLVIEPEATI